MHNLKEIRKDFIAFKKALEKRFIKIDFNKLEDLDNQNRKFIQEKESLEKEKKISLDQKINHYLQNQKKLLFLLTVLLKNKKKLNLI